MNESKLSIVAGSLFQRSISATAKTPTSAKANLLLKLPAELRNKIYALVLADRDSEGRKASSYKGLASACKQIRAEFWPLFWHGAVLRITTDHLPSVLGNFFPYTFASSVHPTSVIIAVGQEVSCNHAYVNVLPILQAKPLCPQADWTFEISETNRRSRDLLLWRQIVTEYHVIPELCKNPAARLKVVLRAAQSGLLRALHCELFGRDLEIKWHLLAQSDGGRLENLGRADLEACCRELCRFDHRSVRYINDVQDKKVTVFMGAEEKEVYLWDPKHRKLILSLDAQVMMATRSRFWSERFRS